MRAVCFLILILPFASQAEDRLSRGQAVFLDYCAMCHGPNGDGKGELADQLPLRPRNFRGEALQWGNELGSVLTTIKRGRSDVMPAFEEVLSPEQIADVAGWVWSLIPAELRGRDFVSNTHLAATGRVFRVRQAANSFVPSKLAARVGDIIVFVNDDVVEHEVQELGKKNAIGYVQRPLQWDRVVLTEAGTQRFGCIPHGVQFEVEVKP